MNVLIPISQFFGSVLNKKHGSSGHPFNTYAKFFEKRTFLTPW